MLKYLIIPIAGLLLTAGTFFHESNLDPQAASCWNNPLFDCSNIVAREKGFPFTLVNEYGSVEGQDQSPDKAVGANEYVAQDSELSISGAGMSFIFWLIVVTVVFWVFTMIRNLVGTVVLVGLGIAVGLVYFGILVL